MYPIYCALYVSLSFASFLQRIESFFFTCVGEVIIDELNESNGMNTPTNPDLCL